MASVVGEQVARISQSVGLKGDALCEIAAGVVNIEGVDRRDGDSAVKDDEDQLAREMWDHDDGDALPRIQRSELWRLGLFGKSAPHLPRALMP